MTPQSHRMIDGTPMAVRYDPANGKLNGEPVAIEKPPFAQAWFGSVPFFAVAPDGIYFPASDETADIWMMQLPEPE
jgi:hypothetical protein